MNTTDSNRRLTNAARVSIHRLVPQDKSEIFYTKHRDALKALVSECVKDTATPMTKHTETVQEFIRTAYGKWDKPTPAVVPPAPAPSISDITKRYQQFKQESAKAARAKPQAAARSEPVPRSKALHAAIGTPKGAVVQARPNGGVKYPDMSNVKTPHFGTFDQVFGCLQGKPIYDRLRMNRYLLSDPFCAAKTHEERRYSICAIFCQLDLISACNCERTKKCLRFLVSENCVTEKEACNDHNLILIMIAILGEVTEQPLKLKNVATLCDKTGILYRTEELYTLMYCIAPQLIEIIKNGNAPRPRYMITLLNPKRVCTWTLQGDTKIQKKDVLNILYRSGYRFKERRYAGGAGCISQCRSDVIQQEEVAASLLGIVRAPAAAPNDDDGGIEPDDSDDDGDGGIEPDDDDDDDDDDSE